MQRNEPYAMSPRTVMERMAWTPRVGRIQLTIFACILCALFRIYRAGKME
jgi:hypothetical protein